MTVPPHPRSRLSIIVLLGLVLSVTAQLVTGFVMMANPGPALLSAHVLGGVAAVGLTFAEWIWLLVTRPGRYRLCTFLAPDSGLSEWSEAGFLAVVTATVVLGVLLAATMHGGIGLPFETLLDVHRGLAVAVAIMYLLHSILAMRRRKR